MPPVEIISKHATRVVKLTNDINTTPEIGMQGWRVIHLHLPTGYNSTSIAVHSLSPTGEWSDTGETIDLSSGTSPPCDRVLSTDRFGNLQLKLVTNNAADNGTDVGLEVAG